MDRPEKIYLEQPIKVLGIEVHHTEEGLRYLVDHYSRCLAVATDQQLSKADRDHCEKFLAQYRQYIELYEQARARAAEGTGEVQRPDGDVPKNPEGDPNA